MFSNCLLNFIIIIFFISLFSTFSAVLVLSDINPERYLSDISPKNTLRGQATCGKLNFIVIRKIKCGVQ